MIWWTKSWNPVIGCTPCSPACENCYAEALHIQRHKAKLAGAPLPLCYAEPFGKVRFLPDRLTQPLHWRKPQRIFVGNMGDLFHEGVKDEWLDRIFAVMALCPQHIFMLLTKRPERMRKYLLTSGRVRAICTVARSIAIDAAPDPDRPHGFGAFHRFLSHCNEGRLSAWTQKGSAAESMFMKEDGGEHPSWVAWPLPNVWLGATIWDQASADRAVPILLETPAAKRFVSVEPMLGPVELEDYLCWRGSLCPCCCGSGQDDLSTCTCCNGTGTSCLGWVICGGETGANARPMHPDWPRKLRDDCQAAGVPFFFKQWGEWGSFYDRDVDDPDWRNCPRCDVRTERYMNIEGGHGFHGKRVMAVRRVGKRKAGRVLDGRTWEEVPA